MNLPRRVVVTASTVVAVAAIGTIWLQAQDDSMHVTGGSPGASAVVASTAPESSPGPAADGPGWRGVGPLTSPLGAGHSATLLDDGRVLLVGGAWGGFVGPTSRTPPELFDPVTATWTRSRFLPKSDRSFHSATLLDDGRVLVAGGLTGDGTSRFASAEIYDPQTDTWKVTGEMAEARVDHAATLLADGRVLVAGGADQQPTSPESAEIYDPATGTWTKADPLLGPGEGLTLTTLSDGRVLGVARSWAGVYAPESGTWEATGPLVERRGFHVAVLLADGSVLVAGGGPCCRMAASAEIFDPATGTWAATGSMSEPRGWFTASLLADGRVLVAGSGDGGYDGVDTTEVYDPESKRWSPGEPMNRDRSEHRAVVLADGRVLVVGGYPAGSNPKAEVYDPTGTPAAGDHAGGILPALRMPTYGALSETEARDYGFTGAVGQSSGMHNVDLDTEIVFAVEADHDDCFARGEGPEPVPTAVGGYEGVSVEPYSDDSRAHFVPQGDETTRASALAVGDRTLCVYLSWGSATSPGELAEARAVLDTVRAQPFGGGGIRIVFTTVGWDSG